MKYLAAEIRFSFEINPLENHRVTDCLDTPTFLAKSDFVVPFSFRHVSSQLMISNLTALVDSELLKILYLSYYSKIVLCNIDYSNKIKR